jgi:uncharacterized protein YggE
METPIGSRLSRLAPGARRRGRGRFAFLTGIGVLSLIVTLGSHDGAAAPMFSPQSQGQAGPYGSQALSVGQPGIVVLGSGEASAPAESGTLQLILRAVPPQGDQSSDVAAPAPGPGGQSPALTDDQVQPVVDALTAAGVSNRSIKVLISPSFGGPFGPGAAQVLITLSQDKLKLASDLVTAGSEAAGQNGLNLESVGAGFEVADCDTLIREARQAAATDARARAEALAEVMKLTLGEILLVSETPSYGDGSGCSTPFPGSDPSATYFPSFDPSTKPEVEVYSQLNDTYAIASPAA